MAGAIYFAIFLAIVWAFKSWRLDKKNKKEREKESAKALERKQNGQKLFSIYKESASSLPFDEQTKVFIALQSVSMLDDKQTKKLIKEHRNGKKINLPFDKQELLKLSKEAKEYIKEIQAKEQEEKWQNYLNKFRAYNKAQQELALEKLKKEGVDDERLFALKMVQLEDKPSQNNYVKTNDSFGSDYASKITQDFLGDNEESEYKVKKNNGNWVYVVIAVVAAFLIFGLIGNFISKKQQENSVKQEVNDVNYCRSVAAQYGQQGTNEFSNAYNACMTGKRW